MILQVKCVRNVTKRFGPHKINIGQVYFVDEIIWHTPRKWYPRLLFKLLGRPGVVYDSLHFEPEEEIIITLPDDIQNINI